MVDIYTVNVSIPLLIYYNKNNNYNNNNVFIQGLLQGVVKQNKILVSRIHIIYKILYKI